MAEFNKNDYDEVLDNLAMRAAEARVEYNKSIGSSPAPDAVDKYFSDYRKRLEKKTPFENIKTTADLDELDNFKGASAMEWLDFGGNSPKDVKTNEEYEKFAPMLAGVAEQGKDWYTMGWPALEYEGAKLGYKVGTKEGRAEFLKKLGEYQQQYDLANNIKEMRSMPEYVLGSLVAPSATKAIENAVATNGDLTPEQAAALAALDVGANSAIFTAPTYFSLKSYPVLSGFLAAGAQGAFEGARQFGANAIDENVEVNPTDITLAATLGATRPGMVGSAQQIVSKVPNQTAYQISRGIMRGTRAGNPAWQERNEIERLFNLFNKRIKKGELDVNGNIRKASLADANKEQSTNAVKDYADFFGIKPNKDGTYNVKDVMKAYDRKPVVGVKNTDKGVQRVTLPEGVTNESEIALNSENEEIYKRLFGAKYNDEIEKSPATKLGMYAGKVLGDIGGRVEPMIKVNPFNLDKQINPNYKNEPWYKKLSDESKKAVDEAFKEKAAQ